jgi:putative phosphoserine phosphatase/1-acylglycerol-3-phosphate O-acyltransferase
VRPFGREAGVKHHAQLTREIREGPEGPKVGAFFDVDRTLLAGFSASAFLRERFLSGRASPREMAGSLLGGLSFALGRTGFSAFLSAHTAAYRGLAESILEELGADVFQKHLAQEIYPEARAIVRAHQERGHTVAIVSSAMPYQVEPLALDLGIEHVLCTRLEAENGVLTGRIIHPACYGKGKLIAGEGLAEQHDLDLEESYFYTDSIADLPLLENVGNPRPLNPDRRLAQIAKERKWPVRSFYSRGTPGIEELARTALALGSIVPSSLAGLGVGLLNRSARDGLNVAGALWGDLTTALAGIDLRVEGEEHLWSQRPAIFLFNHQSGLDAPLMMHMLRRDVTGVAKRELLTNPIFGPFFWASGVVFIDRADTKRAIEALKPAVEALRQGRSLIVAPEGTRQPTPRLGRFKKGAFHLAMQARVPVVPVVFRNVLDALPKGTWAIHRSTVEVVVLPPVDTSGWTVETLDEEVAAIRRSYLDVLEGGA